MKANLGHNGRQGQTYKSKTEDTYGFVLVTSWNLRLHHPNAPPLTGSRLTPNPIELALDDKLLMIPGARIYDT